MDAPLAVIQDIQKHLLLNLPQPPVWEIDTPSLKGTIQLIYPNFKSTMLPKIEITVTHLFSSLLADMTGDTLAITNTTVGREKGFFPPYTFTLIQNTAAFQNKKHTDIRKPWKKGEWSWASEFACRRYHTKTKTYRPSTQKIDNLMKLKDPKCRKAPELITTLFKLRNAITDFRNQLWIVFQDALRQNAASYETFLKYCGLAQLHFLEKQRKKIENQMVDVYSTWTMDYPGGIK